ncbi:MAG: Stf0 family sulfotransferase [Gammaproteobacteria bacterium]|nr:Stf0 family sulfotransferase [Gammaproteobacteria bacterium]
MATVYLHIGAPETANATLQGMLAGNYEQLLAQGVLYPRLLRHGDAHHTLVCDLIQAYQGHTMEDLWYGERTRGEAWADLEREIGQHRQRVDKIILSSELFFGQTQRLEDMLADIRNRLSPHELKVVVYLRRQDQLYGAFFNQDVKGARQWAHNAYQFYQTHQIFRHDYDELLDTWGRAVGRENIVVRPHEAARWVGGNIVEDFCSVVGIAPLDASPARANEDLGPTQLYLKLCLNRVGFDKGENEGVLDVLQQVCPEEPAGPCSYVDRELYRSYRDRWLRVNKRLAETYLDGVPLFGNPIPPAEKVTCYQPEPQRVLESLLALFDHFSGRADLRHRSLFARAMLLILAEQELWEDFGSRRRDALMPWISDEPLVLPFERLSPHEEKLRKYFPDFDFPADTAPLDCPVCIMLFTNRAGSSMVSEHMRATAQFAGFGEPLNAQWVIDRSEREGLGSFPEYLRWETRRLLAEKPGAVLGMKASYGQAMMLMRCGAIPRFFKDVRWVVIQREDLLSQAVSFVIANQTKQWHSFDAGEPADPVYDYEDIKRRLLGLAQSNIAINTFCTVFGLQPYRINYREFSRDPVAGARKLAAYLGVEEVAIDPERLQMEKQRNRFSAQFYQRFITEYQAEMAGAGPAGYHRG